MSISLFMGQLATAAIRRSLSSFSIAHSSSVCSAVCRFRMGSLVLQWFWTCRGRPLCSRGPWLWLWSFVLGVFLRVVSPLLSWSILFLLSLYYGLRIAIFWSVWSNCEQKAFSYLVIETEFEIISHGIWRVCDTRAVVRVEYCVYLSIPVIICSYSNRYLLISVCCIFYCPFPTGRSSFQGDLPDISKKIDSTFWPCTTELLFYNKKLTQNTIYCKIQ